MKTDVKEIAGFLYAAQEEHKALSKKVEKAENRLDALRNARVDNEALQSYLQGEINDKS